MTFEFDNSNETSGSIRESVKEHIHLISNMQLLKEYPVPDEWISLFADDLYHPKSKSFLDAFTEEELKDLAEYYGRLIVASKEIAKIDNPDINAVLKIPEFKALMSFAKELLVRI